MVVDPYRTGTAAVADHHLAVVERGVEHLAVAHGSHATFGPYEAQDLYREHEEELGITMVPFKDMVYVENKAEHLPADQVEAATNYFRAKYLYSLAVRNAESSEGDVSRGDVDQARLERQRLIVGQNTSKQGHGHPPPRTATCRYRDVKRRFPRTGLPTAWCR